MLPDVLDSRTYLTIYLVNLNLICLLIVCRCCASLHQILLNINFNYWWPCRHVQPVGDFLSSVGLNWLFKFSGAKACKKKN